MMSEHTGWEHTGWEHEWDDLPVAADTAGLRREIRAGQDAYRQAWEAGYQAAMVEQAQWQHEAQWRPEAQWSQREVQGHPYRQAAAAGVVAGLVVREGVGAPVRAAGMTVAVALLVAVGVIIGLSALAAAFPGTALLVVAVAVALVIWRAARPGGPHRRS